MNHQNIWKLSEHERRRQKLRAEATAFYAKPKPTDIILDIGCGEGFITKHFTKARFVVGVDSFRESLVVAKQRVRLENVDFLCADAANLPIKTVFDKIILLEVLEHLHREKQQKIIHEADRVLKRKGFLVTSVPYKEQITYMRCIHCGKLTPLWGHLHSFDEHKVTSLLPKNYKLVEKKFLPNMPLISCFKLMEILPLRLWLAINDILGIIRKGYWVIFKYKRV